jgi:hypothetical protein
MNKDQWKNNEFTGLMNRETSELHPHYYYFALTYFFNVNDKATIWHTPLVIVVKLHYDYLLQVKPNVLFGRKQGTWSIDVVMMMHSAAWWCSKDLFHVHDETLVTKDFIFLIHLFNFFFGGYYVKLAPLSESACNFLLEL